MAMGRKLAAMAVVMLMGLVGVAVAVDVCGVDENGLTACKPWVTKPCPTDPPPTSCCEGLSKADFACFCSYKNSFVLPSFGIDPDLALALPVKCNLPNVPTCSTP